MNIKGKLSRIALAIVLMGGANAYAQVAPGMQQQQQATQIEVSEAELEKFADAYKEIQMENQKIQQEMVQVIQSEGLAVERFNEIHEASMTPGQEVDMTAEEEAKHKKVVSHIEQKQVTFQGKIETVIEDKGLTVDRYQEVAMALQTDQELQQKLQSLMEQ